MLAGAALLGAAPAAFGAPSASLELRDPNAGRDMGHSSTYTAGTFRLANTGDAAITRLRIDLRSALFPDLVFDPNGTAGDDVGRDITVNAGGAGPQSDIPQGAVTPAWNDERDGGYDVLDAAIAPGFDPGETLVFGVDVDPTSVKGSDGSSDATTPPAGHVSGAELAGATVIVSFADGSERTSSISVMPQSLAGANWERAARADLSPAPPPAPSLSLVSGAPSPLLLPQTEASQTLRVAGPPGASVTVVVAEGHLNVARVPSGGFDLDEPFEGNMAAGFTEGTVTVGAGGTVDVPVTLTATSPHRDFTAPSDAPKNVGINVVTAYVRGQGGAPGPVSNQLVLALDAGASAPVAQVASPAPGSVGVPTAASVAARFNEPMTVDTTGAALTLRRADTGAIVSGAVAAAEGGTLFTLAPTAPLAPGTSYTASVSGAAIDATRTPVAAPFAWSFTTAGAPPPPGGAPPSTPNPPAAASPGTAQAPAGPASPTLGPTLGPAGAVAARPRCAPVPTRTAGRAGGRVALTSAQLTINRRIARAALQRAQAIRDWLDAGVRARDLCVGALTAAEFAPGVDLAGGPAVEAAGVARPRPLAPARAAPGSRAPLGAASMRTNQRISQQAIRVLNAVDGRLDRGLTGRDVVDGSLTPSVLAPGLLVAGLGAPNDPPPSGGTRTASGATSARVTLSTRQLRINQRISAAAVRRANALQDRLAAGLTGDDIRDGTLGSQDLQT